MDDQQQKAGRDFLTVMTENIDRLGAALSD
jgi:hypothetical protein